MTRREEKSINELLLLKLCIFSSAGITVLLGSSSKEATKGSKIKGT